MAHFQLTNPRQLKRLNNSYQLLRSYYKADQTYTAGSGTVNNPYVYPMMFMLFALEYINQRDNSQQRDRLKDCLIKGNDESVDNNGCLISIPAVLTIANRDLLLQQVEPFVFPAGEKPVKNVSYSE